MRKTYEAPAAEIVVFEAADVITTSVATDYNYDSNGNRTGPAAH